ncbi:MULTISPECIES: GNAT family N-acetyltransferase [unclassified Spirosoma]|uniref:GNAT family N-acetyltransferase n=1 Tax=unclassified Spirosoma TaxID=2621999 RepID=UPI00095DB5A0|nr:MULTISPECIES: GNAT family N-acetyltransferase [unclassified Spirosoma]MBN8825577.1 GNAT family N-acetyltransferase [Spirosoma sp.]OJW74177.1 MAG: GNAT family N-acetyltransferase [Spirosoma sp. 48-14]
MDIQYTSVSELPQEPLLSSLIDLLTVVFSNRSRSKLLAELTYQQSRTGLQMQLALADGRVVGCKLGYERKKGHYYSWLGGVHLDFRGHGIASELMRRQHEWCRTQKYHTIRTQTYNQWRSMLSLNIHVGFDIIGVTQGKRGLAIVLEKKL